MLMFNQAIFFLVMKLLNKISLMLSRKGVDAPVKMNLYKCSVFSVLDKEIEPSPSNIPLIKCEISLSGIFLN